MQCLIIDDDIKYINLLKKNLEMTYQDITIDIFQELPALDLLKEQYDIIFIDILLNDQNGIEYSIKLKEKYGMITVVFMSNQNNFIFQTQKINPLCFIRKSHFEDDFQTFVAVYEEKLQNNLKITFPLDQMDSRNDTYVTLLANDIMYVECFSHKLIIHTYKEEYIVKTPLKEFLNKVDKLKCFVQVHRAYAVNMNYIYRVDKDSLYLLNDDSKNEIHMSKKYKKNFKKELKEFLLL